VSAECILYGIYLSHYDLAVDAFVETLDRLVIGSVALTERAIAAAGADLTFVQWRVVLIVGEHEAGATVGEVAGRLGARSSPASRLISRLRARGVVSTSKDAADARLTRVHLTRSGMELRSRVLRARRDLLTEIAARLRPGPASIRSLELVARALEPYV
jgi:DNA-binding MarR family transcriptional regulator